MARKRTADESASDDCHTTSARPPNHPSHSDVTIICRDRTWRCQRAILCKRCPFFKAALCSGFKESIEQKIDLSADPPAAVEALLLAMYTREYPTSAKLKDYWMRECRHVLKIADKYSVCGLTHAVQRYLIGYYEWGPATSKTKITTHLSKRIWDLEFTGMGSVRAAMVDHFVKGAKDMLNSKEFLQFCNTRPRFMKEFFEALVARIPSGVSPEQVKKEAPAPKLAG